MAQLDRDSPIPLYHQIERALLDLIAERGLAAGDLAPSENELVLRFGVTRPTVRRAIERLTRQGVLRRERGRGTFVADPALAARLKTGTLTFVLPMTSVVHLQTLAGAQQEAHLHGYQLAVVHSADDPSVEARQFSALSPSGAAGLLLWPGAHSDSAHLSALREVGVPYVFLDRYPEDVAGDHVVVADRDGAHAATRHLTALGHRRIALFLFEDVEVSAVRLRRDGYRRALADGGLTADPDLVFLHPMLPGPTNLDQMTTLVGRMMDRPDPPTAAFCVNDHLAQSLLIALQRRGIAVPSDFSIAGFDGLEYLPTHVQLTTVRRATGDMGRQAVRLLVERLNGGAGAPPRHVMLPTDLVVGETTAPRRTTAAVAERR